MNPLKEFFESGQTILWIETLNAVAFLRPILDTVVRTPCPASRLAEFLRLGKISLALTQLLLAREQVAVREHARQRIFQAPGDLLEEPALRGGPGPGMRALVKPEQVRPVPLGTNRNRDDRFNVETFADLRRDAQIGHRPRTGQHAPEDLRRLRIRGKLF